MSSKGKGGSKKKKKNSNKEAVLKSNKNTTEKEQKDLPKENIKNESLEKQENIIEKNNLEKNDEINNVKKSSEENENNKNKNIKKSNKENNDKDYNIKQSTEENKDNNKRDNTKKLAEESKDNDKSDNEKQSVEEKSNNEKINNIENLAKENNETINNAKKIEETKNLSKEEKETKNINRKKKKWYTVFFIFILLVIITVFSTIFAILNVDNSNFPKGLKIKNIDVSGLSIEEAKTKVEKALSIELMQNLNIKYEDKYEVNLETAQIEFVYDTEKAINEAYKVGRDENILKNNYVLLYTAFFGKNIDIDYTYNEEFLNNFINDAESKLPGVVIQPSYYIEEEQLIINKGTDGLGFDKEILKEKILKNIKNRNAEKIINNKEEQKIEFPIISKTADPIDLDIIYKEIYTEPKDAYYELEPFNIYPEVNGIDLEIGLDEAKNQIKAEEKEEYRFNLKITPPEKTIKSFGIEAFPNLISSFSTKYVASNINRSKNLEIAAGKINGLVLLPGEVFSFNKVVGKRTVEEGYRDAKIYQDGAVVDGLAGGICQISSTLYNAVLLANLEIVERRNHSFTTSYAPAGRDATVVYGNIDFQFKNSRSYPIKIEASVSKGIATFKIHSVALEENEYEVKIIPVITQSIPYTVEHIQDPTLLPGQQVVQQAGQPGYRVTTYKELIQNGVSISKEVISNDVYRPMRNIIKIGP